MATTPNTATTSSEKKPVETKILTDDSKIKLTLFSGNTGKGDKIWFQKFIFEEGEHILVLNESCDTAYVKYPDGNQSKAKIEQRNRTTADGTEDSFNTAKIGKFDIYLNDSAYQGCKYYATIKVSKYEAPVVNIDIDTSSIF